MLGCQAGSASEDTRVLFVGFCHPSTRRPRAGAGRGCALRRGCPGERWARSPTWQRPAGPARAAPSARCVTRVSSGCRWRCTFQGASFLPCPPWDSPPSRSRIRPGGRVRAGGLHAGGDLSPWASSGVPFARLVCQLPSMELYKIISPSGGTGSASCADNNPLAT